MPVLSRRVTAILLLLAALLELAETVLSPLADGSNAVELDHIAAHPDRFALSVLLGTVSTVLFGPAFLGLAVACRDRAPRASLVAGWATVSSFACFMAVRGTQVVQLQLATSSVPRHQAAAVLDGATASVLGLVVDVGFLGAALVALVALCVATWRSGYPRVAALGLPAFLVVDLGAPGHLGTVVSHTVLLAAVAGLAPTLWRSAPGAAFDGESDAARARPAAAPSRPRPLWSP